MMMMCRADDGGSTRGRRFWAYMKDARRRARAPRTSSRAEDATEERCSGRSIGERGALRIKFIDSILSRILSRRKASRPAITRAHAGTVRAVAILRTGEAALTGSDDKTMKLHALTRTSEGEDGDNAGISLRYQATFVGHTNWIRDVCVASDLAVACSASDDRTTRLWDVERVKCVRVFGEGGGEVYVARFHPQGNVLASAGGSQSIRFWDTRSGRMSLEIDAAHDASVRSLDFHPGGVYASSTSDDGSIKFWDLRTGSMCYTLRAHGEHGVRDGKFSPAGSRFVSSGEDGHCVVWRTNTVDHAENAPKMETRSFSHAQRSRSLPFCAEIDDAPLVSWPSPRLRALRVSEHPRPPQNRPEYLPRAPSRDIRAQVDYLRQVARALHIRLVDVEDGLVGTPVARARGRGRPGL